MALIFDYSVFQPDMDGHGFKGTRS